MDVAITNGIKITVISRFEPKHSSINESRYVFSYNIKIQNESDYTIKVLRRHWYILDSNCNKREVQGDGIVGEQPIIRPGDYHEYTSWCPFNSEIGMMSGFLTVRREIDQELLDIMVPDFTMCALPRLN